MGFVFDKSAVTLCSACTGHCLDSECHVLSGLCTAGCEGWYTNYPHCDILVPAATLPVFILGYLGETSVEFIAPLADFDIKENLLANYVLKTSKLNVANSQETELCMDAYKGHLVVSELEPNTSYSIAIHFYRNSNKMIELLENTTINLSTGLYWN